MTHRLRLLAYNVRSLWNVGSFFRTCDAFAVERLYLTGYTGHPPRKEITKTAIGAEEFVPWEHHTNPIPVIEELKRSGWQIVALEITPAAIPLHEFPLPTGEGQPFEALPSALKTQALNGRPSGPNGGEGLLLIVGHELTGVPEDILSHCDSVVKIPMHGKKESLNVAVAVGIALFAMMKESCPSTSHHHSRVWPQDSRSMRRMHANL